MNAHEEGFARSFVVKNKRERVAMLLASDKRRSEFTKSLSHFKDIDPAYARVVSPREAHTPAEWCRLFPSKGAPVVCWVVSEDGKIDGRELPLKQAMAETLGRGVGTLLSCVAGKLAYFEDEDGQWLLER